MNPLEIKIIDAVSSLSTDDWDRLVPESCPFLEYGFLTSLEKSGCLDPSSGWVPQIICAYDGEDLVGAIPFYLKAHSAGEFVFDWSWADAAHRAGISYYPKGVAAVPFTPVTGARILTDPAHEHSEDIARSLIESALRIADDNELSSVHFNFIPGSTRHLFEEIGLPIRLGIQYHWQNHDGTEEGQPYKDFDQFLSRFRSKKRANIRRERRKLTEAGATTVIRQAEELTEDDMRRVFHYYQDTVNKYYYGQLYLNEEFFLRILTELPHRLHVVFAQQAGKDFGAAFNLVSENRLYGRYWGCEEDVRYAHFETCIYRPVEWCIENDIRAFEPGAGGDHKYERGFEPTLTYSAHYLRHPALRRGITDFIERERNGITEKLAQMREESPIG